MNRTLKATTFLTTLLGTALGLAGTAYAQFNTAPAITRNGGQLAVYAGESANGGVGIGVVVRKRFINGAWEQYWQPYQPSGGPAVYPYPSSEVAAVASYNGYNYVGDSVCIRDISPNYITCSFPFRLLGNWKIAKTGTSASPALASYAGWVFLFVIDANGVLLVAPYNVASGADPIFSPIPGAPVGMTGIAATSLGLAPGYLQICGQQNDQYLCTVTNNLVGQTTWTPAPGSYGSRPALAFGQLGQNWFYPQMLGLASWEPHPWETNAPLGQWSGPQPVGGDINTALTVVGTGGVAFTACARASFDYNIWCTTTSNGTNWGGWFHL
jgi:hypothetical protein